MNRRESVRGLLAFAVSGFSKSSIGQSQEKIWKLGWLSPADGPGPNHEAFVQQLKKLGYEQGKNLKIEWAWVGPRTELMSDAAIKLVQGNPDILVTQSQVCALALQKVNKFIPAVFVGVRDPVKIGLVASMGRPGANITGLTLTPNEELVVKHLELLSEIVPKASRLAVFWNPDVPIQGKVIETISAIGQGRGLAVRAFGVHRPGDIERAFEVMARERFHGLLTLVEWFTFGQRPLIAKLAIANRIPTLFEVKDYVKSGGLLSYGVIYHEHFAAAAEYVDKILKGAKPGDIPVQQPAKLELVVNLKTANALGIKIPQVVLIRADEVIE